MRILFATNSLNMGGIETNLVLLTQALTARGHEVIAATGGGSLVPAFEQAGGMHRLIDFSLDPRSLRRASAELLEVITSAQPDVIHCFSASTQPAAWLARRQVRRTVGRPPLITSVMGIKNDPKESALITYLRAYLTTIGADKVVVIAPAIGTLLDRLPIGSHRLIHQPLVGVQVPSTVPDPSVGASVRDELGLSHGDQVVMTMGSLEPRKSHELFIRAAARVLEKAPDVHFLVIGGGHLKQAFQKQIDESGFAARISLADERLDGPRILAAADVYVRPGVVEGFVGITVLEAQAVGIPVVSFETEDVKLAITDGETGLLVKNGDVDELAEAILRLLTDPDLAADLSEKAFVKVRNTFSIDAVVTGLEGLYQREIELSNAGRRN